MTFTALHFIQLFFSFKGKWYNLRKRGTPNCSSRKKKYFWEIDFCDCSMIVSWKRSNTFFLTIICRFHFHYLLDLLHFLHQAELKYEMNVKRYTVNTFLRWNSLELNNWMLHIFLRSFWEWISFNECTGNHKATKRLKENIRSFV